MTDISLVSDKASIIERRIREDNENLPKYSLPAHIHFCVTDGVGVILDIRRDKYYGLTKQQTCALLLVLQEDHRQDGSSSHPIEDADNETLNIVRDFVDAGLLVSNRIKKCSLTDEWLKGSGRIAQKYLPPPSNVRIRTIDVFRMLSSVLVAVFEIKFYSFESIVRRAQRIRSAARSTDLQQEIVAVLALTEVFRRIQPYLFTARNKCFFHSLALLKFLALYGYRPNWIFAVRTAPFGAHCWIQFNGILLNTTPEQANIYTPIFAI